MGDLLQPWHLIVLGVLAFLLFGARRLPELGKGLGEGLKGFKEGLKGMAEPPAPAPTVQQTQVAPPPVASAPVQTAQGANDASHIICTRCGSQFENPHGFKVADFVCRNCQTRS